MAQLALPLAAASSLLAFQGERGAAKVGRAESQVAASQEELAVTQREADRKERLAEALASQNAQAGASGIAAFEGSPLTILNEDIRRESVATERDVFQSRLKAGAIRSSGKVKSKLGRIRAATNLLQSGSNIAGAV